MIGQQFITAGRAVFTLSGKASRFTYRINRKDPEPGSRYTQPTFFVSLLNGPDNTADYRYLGILDPLTGYVRLTKGSKVGLDAPSVKAIQWALPRLWAAQPMPSCFAIHHEGKCGRCGRALTVPESVATGFGLECATILGLEWTRRSDGGEGAVSRPAQSELAERNIREGALREVRRPDVAYVSEDVQAVLLHRAHRSAQSVVGQVFVHGPAARQGQGAAPVQARNVPAMQEGEGGRPSSSRREYVEQFAAQRPVSLPKVSHGSRWQNETHVGYRGYGKQGVGASKNTTTVSDLFAVAFEEA